ncbi:MAG: M48 family metalloprotease [Burkholderiales bacterium]|nr:M48 family metalloprotease [Burkholderiales bacterium]
MNTRRLVIFGGSLVLVAAISTGVSHAQSKRPGLWDVEKLAEFPSAQVRLRKPGSDEVSNTVDTSRVRLLRDVKRRIEREAGIIANFGLTDFGMPYPNAFSTRNEKGTFVVMNLALFNLLGDDRDAIAAVVGHEYAHIALNHRDARKEREEARRGISTILGFALGMAGVPMAGTLSNLGTTAIARTFTRDEERDADEKGIRYAAAAGFSVEGGIRAWEKMSTAAQQTQIPFLATHPSSNERIETMRQLARTYARTVPQSVAASEVHQPAGSSGIPTAPIAVAAVASDTRWSFGGREFLKSRGVTFAEQDRVVRVFDVASEAQSSLRIGDLVKSCLDTGSSVTSIRELLECRKANDASVVRVGVVRDGVEGTVDLKMPETPIPAPAQAEVGSPRSLKMATGLATREVLRTTVGGRMLFERVISETPEAVELLTVYEEGFRSQSDRWLLNCREGVVYWHGYEAFLNGRATAQTNFPSPKEFRIAELREKQSPEVFPAYHVLKLCDRLPN